jgi:peptide/nickel transport system substrate-binding protein
MTIRSVFLSLLGLALLTGCGEKESGPIQVSAIGQTLRIVDPNQGPLDAPSAFLVGAVAQGLVRFDASGEIEPALAQSWIVSDDGLRYTFRLSASQWSGGGRVTSQQVVRRLRSALGRTSRNPLRPVLGAIDDIEAMTDEVLEISLKSPRVNFLQLLAQPEMAILRGDQGSGPFRVQEGRGSMLLSLPPPEESTDSAAPPPILLRGEPAALAVARFDEGLADLVLGGTAGTLPLARAAQPAAGSLVFDPVAGLFGLIFAGAQGPFAEPAARHALSMAIDRAALVTALGVPGLQPREALLPPGLPDQLQPTLPDWTLNPLPARRALARRILGARTPDSPLRIRVAMPPGPGYRLVFAHLRRDWRLIGVTAEQVAAEAPADLRFVDQVAPAELATWYLRRFACEASPICDPAADEMLAAARIAPDAASRRGLIANADRILAGAAPFIPIGAPVRWSLVGPRLTGFRANRFGLHAAGELTAEPS